MNIRNISLFMLLVSLCGCSTNQGSAVVNGRFFGHPNTKLAVEKVLPGAASRIIDTLSTNGEGYFNFEVAFEENNPLFVNVRTRDSYVPLLLESGENVKVESIGNIYNNYKVAGSKGSEKLHELNTITTRQIRAIDSIQLLFSSTLNQRRAEELGREYMQANIQLKRDVIRFVVSNPHSLAVIVPLYQPMVEGRYIFEEPSDIIYYRAIADSLNVSYPNSPYVVSLLRDVERSREMSLVDSTFLVDAQTDVISLPPLLLKDAEGNMRDINEVAQGKVLLLDVTQLASTGMRARNRELIELYEKYSDRGFEIYQVSIDENRAAWQNTVVESRIPWVAVNDPRGSLATVLSSYNVTQMPSNFLIDRETTIVARDINSVEEIEIALKELL